MRLCGIRRPFIVAAAITAALALVALLLVDVVSPRSRTVTRFDTIATRILEYAQANDGLPDSLRNLPPRQGYDNNIQDGWGRDILYQVTADGAVTLTSHGEDGRAGGQDDGADLVATFSARGSDGKWRSEVQWTYMSWQSVGTRRAQP